MVVSVLVEISNRNVDKTFSYAVPDFLQKDIKVGIRVKVPFTNRELEGFVLEIIDGGEVDGLKEVIAVVDRDIVLDEELLKLGKWISETTLATLISSYQVMLPKALKAQNKTDIKKKYVKYIVLNDDFDLSSIKLNDQQNKIISLVKEGEVLKRKLQDISLSSVNTLIKKGVLKEIEKETYRLNITSDDYQKLELTAEQKKVRDEILNSNDQIFLLHGVTGSGKTEVYMDLIDEMKKKHKTSIVLVPEISLTPQIISRFEKRFGNNIAILHSRLSEGEKYDEYRKISHGEVDIVIGARSAVFAPLKNIGIIIIDEEHTNTYKQDNDPKYSAIDVAIKRAEYHGAKVILGSATPSLESYAKAIKKVYHLVELKNRVSSYGLPEVQIVDLNKEKNRGCNFSKLLSDKIREKLSLGEQIILLLNRRGYSSFVSCTNCGYVAKCPNCDITLTYHKSSNTLRCHYCGYGDKVVHKCPECGEEALTNRGVGTEKIEEEIKKNFTERVVRMDFDTTTKKGAHEKIINDFQNKKYDILLGTQMIAKGLDFENVTLVGVINADTSLMIPNFRSSEYTFELLSQVAGRSGRSKKKGEVIIQTFNPDYYAIKYAKTHDYLSFFKEEMSIRRTLSYSPYYYLVNVKIKSSDYDLAKVEANRVGAILKENLKSSIVLGPSVCSVFRVNNVYRFGIIIKYKKEDKLYTILKRIIEHYKSNNKVKIDIDFNPSNI